MRTLKMTLFLFSTLLLFPMLANAQTSDVGVTLEFDNAASALELVQNYVKALQEGDVNTMNAQLADNAMVYGLGGGMDSLNVVEHKAYYLNSTSNYNHVITQDLYLPVKVTKNWNEGEWVLAWGTNTITNKKTGKTTTIPYHTANLIQNGKVIMIRYFYDVLNVLKTQGYPIPAPKE
ncbi:hypothetical protein SAMN05421636_107250 [Pricia antarctica]|uniref:SnoaL-like domain-containing protein n=1 Tax=Pricia antarctica TaxID=641691 RepID=A0A1G7FS35_9FLAO|nr:hypothetical protein [Pricia antarctica]SDE78612.1 hypothetical protein SAMN05421636_107250 [Pricia antarctica]